MLVLVEYAGRDLLIRAKPIGKNGYHVGTVVYDEPKDEGARKTPEKPKAPKQPEPKKHELHGPSTTLDRARKHPRLMDTWSGHAKAFHEWLVTNKRSAGLVSKLFDEYRLTQNKNRNPQLAFHTVAAGEALGLFKIRENSNRTRFTIEVLK